MSLTITVDTSAIDSVLQIAEDALVDMSDGLSSAVEQTVIPNLEEVSTEEWNVVTGAYSLGWEILDAVGNTVTVGNTALALSDGYPYSLSLEYGWTGRHGDVHEGGYVATTVAETAADELAEALAEWLQSQLS